MYPVIPVWLLHLVMLPAQIPLPFSFYLWIGQGMGRVAGAHTIGSWVSIWVWMWLLMSIWLV